MSLYRRTILAMPLGRRRPRCTFRRPDLHELSSLTLLHSHVIRATRSRRFLYYIVVQRPRPLCAIEIYEEKQKTEINRPSQINLCYEIAVCISPKGLDSINVTLPDGCPNKRRLPRDSEQL